VWVPESTATPAGALPTGTVAMTVRVEASITDTVPADVQLPEPRPLLVT
jgi:hypothetical protein